MAPVLQCEHTDQIREVSPSSKGCSQCLEAGTDWVYLRVCLSCGEVGCCDSSVGKHARKHASVDGHAIVESLEPGENWRYCYVDEKYVRDNPSPS